jgi:hypothetical protein
MSFVRQVEHVSLQNGHGAKVRTLGAVDSDAPNWFGRNPEKVIGLLDKYMK